MLSTDATILYHFGQYYCVSTSLNKNRGSFKISKNIVFFLCQSIIGKNTEHIKFTNKRTSMMIQTKQVFKYVLH